MALNEKKYRSNFESDLIFLEKTKLLRKKSRILEIGSGNGWLMHELMKRGYDICGAEINQKRIDISKRLYGPLPVKKVDSEVLPYKNNSFDLVISFDVFEHIPNTNKHLQEVKRVLKKEGYYLLSTPNKLPNMIFEMIKERSLTKYKSYHCSLHSYRTIKKRFKKNAFTITFVNVPVVNKFFKEKVSKYLGNAGTILIKIIDPDRLPLFLRTNFYLIAKNECD